MTTDRGSASRDSKDPDTLFSNLIAEEGPLDRAMMFRLGVWGLGAVSALTVAILLNQPQFAARQASIISRADLADQAQRIQWVSDSAKAEARRLSSATETLQNDRDRLFARVAGLEQTMATLESLNASAQPKAAPTAAAPPAEPSPSSASPSRQNVAAVSETKTEAARTPPKTEAPSGTNSPDAKLETKTDTKPEPAVAAKPAETFATPADPVATGSIDKDATAKASVSNSAALTSPIEEPSSERPEFGVDLGAASSLQALRGMWSAIRKTDEPLLGSLRPIVSMKERNNGLGLQLHLVAGPLTNAAAAKLCAAMVSRDQSCEPVPFDGQRLAIDAEKTESTRVVVPRPTASKRRRAAARQQVQQPPPATEPSAFRRLIGAR